MTFAEYIYQQLRKAGVTKEGACAVLGNVQAESAFRANNLQDSFNSRLGISDDEFVRRVDAGDYSLFMTRDLGFGAAQWTYGPRKEKFYRYAKSTGRSIANEKMQVEFLIKEFKEDFAGIWKLICTSTDLIACTDKLLEVWENPAYKDYSNRRKMANSWYAKVDQLEATAAGEATNTSSKGSGSMSKVEQYTWEAESIAADNSHGYSQNSRWGPDYDCSSLVIQVVQNAGIPVRTNGASYTGNMRSAFQRCGFQDVTASCNLATGAGMIRGDVLLNDSSHAAIHVGNGRVVHARTDEGNSMTGDQSGNEIRVQSYWNYPWNCVLRYPGGGSSAASDSASSSTSQSETGAVVSTNLRKGSKGAKVKELQENLIKLGYDLGKWGADGDFGEDTRAAVIEFQKDAFPDNKAEWDGIVGKNTRAAIEKALEALNSKAPETKKTVGKGDVVNFKGGLQYLTAKSEIGSKANAGKAKITQIYSGKGAKHPFHLVRVAGGGSNVYGWVDESDIEAI